MSKQTQEDDREERLLAKPLIQAGQLKNPGQSVWLRPDQIMRLQGEGYLQKPSLKRGVGKEKEMDNDG